MVINFFFLSAHTPALDKYTRLSCILFFSFPSHRFVAMAEKEVPELDVGHYEEDAVSNFEERGVDVEGLGETKPTPSPKEQTPDTISQFSQFSVDEPDGKSTGKKKKKLKVVRDGKST